jgi:hypothetical protein
VEPVLGLGGRLDLTEASSLPAGGSPTADRPRILISRVCEPVMGFMSGGGCPVPDSSPSDEIGSRLGDGELLGLLLAAVWGAAEDLATAQGEHQPRKRLLLWEDQEQKAGERRT